MQHSKSVSLFHVIALESTSCRYKLVSFAVSGGTSDSYREVNKRMGFRKYGRKKIHNLSLLFTVVLSCGRIRSLKSANFVKWLGCVASKIHVFAFQNKGTFGISKA